MTAGERIRARRQELGMTMAQLGELVGVDKTTIKRWEDGAIEKVDYRKVIAIADALHVSFFYIAGEENRTAAPNYGGGLTEEIYDHVKEMDQGQQQLLLAQLQTFQKAKDNE